MEGILSRQDKPQPVCLAKKFGPSHGVSGELLNGLCVYVCVCVCIIFVYFWLLRVFVLAH